MSGYNTPCAAVECVHEVKKSRFIARLAPAESKQQAQALIEQAKRDHPEARHHCSAYLIGAPHSAQQAAMDDDGEPGGTAGKPIFNVISHKNVGDVVVVVIRYFGGIKLGAGGLVRAYAAATQNAFEQATLCPKIPRVDCRLLCNFAQESELRRWLLAEQAEIGEVVYGQQVALPVRITLDTLAALKTRAQAQGFIIEEL